jgi:hypothetical protein
LAGRDITEGDGNIWDLAADGLPIARGMSDIGIGSSSAYWQNTDIAYDVALGGMPFVYATNDARPHIRQTASFKKQQFDNAAEPGEQTLEGWWIRSQMSFHSGTGINFFDPATNDENGHYRFADSRNIDVWTKGQVTLLKETAALTGVSSGIYKLISIVDGSTDKILGWIPASTTIKNYTSAGTAVEYTDAVTAGLDTSNEIQHLSFSSISAGSGEYKRNTISGFAELRLSNRILTIGTILLNPKFNVYVLNKSEGFDRAI